MPALRMPYVCYFVGLAVFGLWGCEPRSGITRQKLELKEFDFSADASGWVSGFADVSIASESAVGFVADYRLLPGSIGERGLYQEGANVSDDLCMWWTGRFDGLTPGARFRVGIDVTIVSDYPFGCDFGIAASTNVKAGVAPYRPEREVISGYWRINVDKGLPWQDGTQALSLGDIRNAIAECQFLDSSWGARDLSSGDRELDVEVSEDGTLWVIVMTDSTWEAWYRVYFTRVGVRLRSE